VVYSLKKGAVLHPNVFTAGAIPGGGYPFLFAMGGVFMLIDADEALITFWALVLI
jgi:hypothetical protein